MIGRIRLIKSNGKEATLQVKKNQILTIGRSSKCSVRINDIKMSRVHCKLWEKNGAFFLEDAESRNGTLIDGRKITQREKLNSPCRIEIGDTKMEFELEEVELGREEIPVKPKPKPQLKFCENCAGSIPAAQIESGEAREIEGSLLCGECISKILEEQTAPVEEESALEPVDVAEEVEEVLEMDDADEDIPTEKVVDEPVEPEPAEEAPAFALEETDGDEAYDFSGLDTEAAPVVTEEEKPVDDSGPIDVIDFSNDDNDKDADEDVEDSGPIDIIDFKPE